MTTDIREFVNKFRDALECPKCHESWDGGDIYEYFKTHKCLVKHKKNEKCYHVHTNKEALETAKMYGWSKKNKVHFNKQIGIEDPMKYDGVSWIQCPFCKTTWNVWTGQEEKLNLDDKEHGGEA